MIEELTSPALNHIFTEYIKWRNIFPVSASTVAILRIKRSSYLENELLLYFLEWQGYENKGRLITP